MGQVLHGSATTTAAIRRAIQHSQESLRALAIRYGINQKTVAKWRHRGSTGDLPTGPLEAKSTVLSVDEEATVVAFRRHTLLPLDDCLYALQATIPQLPQHPCIAASNDTPSPACPMSRETRQPKANSRPIPSATSTSTTPRSPPRKASSTCWSPLPGPPSSPLSSCVRKPPGASRVISFAP